MGEGAVCRKQGCMRKKKQKSGAKRPTEQKRENKKKSKINNGNGAQKASPKGVSRPEESG